MMIVRQRLCCWLLVLLLSPSARSVPPELNGRYRQESIPSLRGEFGDWVGGRIDRNIAHWLAPLPWANPGVTQMFFERDRLPAPNVVPWAGEFAGKYLLGAAPALRCREDAALKKAADHVFSQLLAAQQDGYLGPFPRKERLLGQWDLWGHYHLIEALLLWETQTGDERALACAKGIADLVCRTYLDGKRRVFDAGSHEMNMAIIHGLGMMYRRTGEPRYRAMMREIERDFERAGDYVRTGQQGVEFFRTPRPRWESLHDLQGIVELFLITGESHYRDAFLHHWESIRRFDVHNTGGFSSGEAAVGNPYDPGAIETCCTIAWMAISIDALQLTGESRVADELERATYNAVLGAQHPSGRWWTYNTPMDGVREASAHTIVFQSRAGTPELNCCSVNASRGLSMLLDWAIQRRDDGLALHYFGPGKWSTSTRSGKKITLISRSRYPFEPSPRWEIDVETPQAIPLFVRVPAWSKKSTIRVNDEPPQEVGAGDYVRLDRTWKRGDRIHLNLDMTLRREAGDRGVAGKASIWRGPILLAYDQAMNAVDAERTPTVTPRALQQAKIQTPTPAEGDALAPWLVVTVPSQGGEPIVLTDYASAGAKGTPYRSWIPSTELPPPPALPLEPVDRASVPSGKMLFSWARSADAAHRDRVSELVIARHANLTSPMLKRTVTGDHRVLLDERETKGLEPGVPYYWGVVARNQWGESLPSLPARRFQINPTLPPLPEDALRRFGERDDGVVTEAPLDGKAAPTYGTLESAAALVPANGPRDTRGAAIEFNGKQSRAIFAVRRFPTEEYTLSLWLWLPREGNSSPKTMQVASAWTAAMDDPMRLCVIGGKLYGRIEAGQGYSTPGISIENDRWHHVAMVKEGSRLSVFVDGRRKAETGVPADLVTHSTAWGIGGNPRYSGDEFLAARLAQVRLFARALSDPEIQSLATQP